MVIYSRKNRIRLFYLGSGEIGIPVLDSLESCPDIELVGCATQPDRPKGRKRILTSTPIGQRYESLGHKPEKPNSVNSPNFVDLLRSLDLDVILVFSFGQILRNPILNLPTYGCLNIHASLLPSYRGASPINAAILAGDCITGISFMKMDEGLDTGPIYQQFEIKLSDDINAQKLEKKMSILAAKHVTNVVANIVKNGQIPHNQSSKNVSYAHRIKKDDGRIQWSNEAILIERKVRAFYPWPGAWFILNVEKYSRKITVTSAVVDKDSAMRDIRPGTVVQASHEGLGITCGKDILVIKKLIPEGKREMTVTDYLRGNPVQTGSIIQT